MRPIASGDLRHSVSVQARSTTQDATGGVSDTWVTTGTMRAFIRMMSFQELTQANKMSSQVSHEIWVRYNPAVPCLPGMRILYGARVFLIQAPDNVEERNRVLRLMCMEIFN